jgi:hypothetical protein
VSEVIAVYPRKRYAELVMISYTDFDFAIARWRARVGGAPQAAPEPASGTVETEVPVATAPESPADADSGAVATEVPVTDSGLVVSDAFLDAPGSDSEDPNT